MPDLLTKGADFLAGKTSAGGVSRTVVYRRGGQSVSLKAAVGQSVFEVDNGQGVAVQVESRDFLVVATELLLGGALIEPERGDTITETRGGKTLTYEVLAPGGEQPWRWDPCGVRMRIHTKLIAEN